LGSWYDPGKSMSGPEGVEEGGREITTLKRRSLKISLRKKKAMERIGHVLCNVTPPVTPNYENARACV